MLGSRRHGIPLSVVDLTHPLRTLREHAMGTFMDGRAAEGMG